MKLTKADRAARLIELRNMLIEITDGELCSDLAQYNLSQMFDGFTKRVCKVNKDLKL